VVHIVTSLVKGNIHALIFTVTEIGNGKRLWRYLLALHKEEMNILTVRPVSDRGTSHRNSQSR